MGVVPTAIVQPRHLHTQIARKRLTDLSDAVDASRVTTLYAPAGYGKTTAMLQWADDLSARGRTVLWLAARAGIRSLDDFSAALLAAIKQAGIDCTAHPCDAPLNELIARLAAEQGNRLVLVIDDAQILPADALNLVTHIVASARDALTTIIASRSMKTIPIARLRSLGYLLEVGAADLCFTLAETSELIARNGQGPVDTELLQHLVDTTQGWPAGIAMARSIQHKDWTEGCETPLRLSGLRREFESYFSEEVVSPEPLPVRDFLVSTAILDELTPSACAAVMNCDDSRQMLETVEESGLFLQAVDADRSSYRYHPLFREMVVRRLYDRDPSRAAELQRRASRHYAATGNVLQAILHAEWSGDHEFLADQLDILAEPLVYGGYLYRVNEAATGMTSVDFAARPMLALALAWRRIRSLAFESAESLIGLAETHLAHLQALGAADTRDLRHLSRVIDHRRIMLGAARDDMTSVERGAETLLREFGDDQPYLSCSLLAQLMASRRELYHFHDMLRLEAETRRALGRPGSDFASISLKASVAPTLVVQGKIETAEQMLREALEFASKIEGSGSGLAALPALPLAELFYDRGQLEEARELVEIYLPLAREWGFVDQLAAGHVVRARLLFNDGDLPAALKALDETHLLAIECGLTRLRAYAVGEQVRMLVRSGEPRQAHAALVASGLEPEGEPYPTLNPTRQHECIAIAWLRLEMQSHRLVRARKVAKRWTEFVRRNGAIRSAVVFELLLAEIAVLAGDRSEARRAVREAVTLAAPAGWTRIFLDEGDAIVSLLVEAYGQGPMLDSVPDQFAAKLVAAFNGSTEPEIEIEYGLGSRLVNRELDILRMVGGGLRNREIGNRLGLTEGTVKWYMQQIYDKLGVRRRPQAVMRARHLGILA